MTEQQTVAASFETQIRRIEEAIGEAERLAAATLARLRGLRRRARDGDIAQASAQIEQIARQLAPLDSALRAAQMAAMIDVPAALSDGSYIAELLAEARDQGLVITERDGRLTAFPLLLRLLPKSATLRIGNRQERRLRPARLVAELRKRQGAGGFHAGRKLDELFRAYAVLAPRHAPGWQADGPRDGPVVALNDLYDLLTLRGTADYPRDAFAVDLLRLDRAPDARTNRGHRFALPASTGSKGSNRIGVYDEAGVEHVYFGIRFTLGHQAEVADAGQR